MIQFKLLPPYGPVTITLQSSPGRPQFAGRQIDVDYCKSNLESAVGKAGHISSLDRISAIDLDAKLFAAFGPQTVEVLEGKATITKERKALGKTIRSGRLP